MRWKATECSNNEDNSSKMEMYELKLLSPPRLVKDLTPFENELTSLVKNIKFKKFLSNNRVFKKMQRNGENKSFISLKDQKENF